MLLDERVLIPDYIFVDINMPVMSGREFLNIVKNTPRLRTIPVFMYSTSSLPQERTVYISLGAREVFTKPSAFEGIKDLLLNVLRPAHPIDGQRK
jgi:CheY-like chemotaxis protein